MEDTSTGGRLILSSSRSSLALALDLSLAHTYARCARAEVATRGIKQSSPQALVPLRAPPDRHHPGAVRPDLCFLRLSCWSALSHDDAHRAPPDQTEDDRHACEVAALRAPAGALMHWSCAPPTHAPITRYLHAQVRRGSCRLSVCHMKRHAPPWPPPA